MPTKDELEAQNEALEAENADLRSALQAAGGANAERRQPARPVDKAGKPVLSAGEQSDLEMHGVTISPFNGQLLNAIDEGVEPGSEEAKRRALDAKHKRGAFAEGAHVSTHTTGNTPAPSTPAVEQE